MENRQRLLAIVLVAVMAVLGGFALGALFTGGSGGSADASSPVAQASGSHEPGSSVPTASDGPSSEPGPTAEPSLIETPTATPLTRARVTFTDLRLDAQDDPDGKDRILTFVTGRGSITVEVTSITPQGDTIMCLSTRTVELGCRTAGSGRLSAKTTKPKETFLVTLRGEAIAQPVIEVKLTFPAKSPSVTIENARFDGTDYPETNGIKVIFTARDQGTATIRAEWGGKPLMYRIDLAEQGQPGVTTYEPDQGDIGTDQSFDVRPGDPWVIVLLNTESGFGVTPMTATLTWP